MGYDKELTKQLLGEVGPLRFNPVVIKVCDGCGKQERRRYKGRGKPTASYYCCGCVLARPEVKAKQSALTRQQWQSDQFRQLVQDNSRAIWEDPQRRKRMSTFRDSADFRERMTQINRTKHNDPAKLSAAARRRWAEPAYRARLVEVIGQRSRELWQGDEYRAKMTAAVRAMWQRPEFRDRITAVLTKASHEFWADPANRTKISELIKQVWADPEWRTKALEYFQSEVYRAKCATRAAEAVVKRVSKPQEVLYSLLDDLGVPYFREYNDQPNDPECVIGPHSVDCVVPRAGRPALVIEVQGDYYHNIPKRVVLGRSKASYISNNFPGRYELKAIWEHEFKNYGKVLELLKYWLGITELEIAEFSIKDVVIKDCPASDYRLLLSKYHYIANAGRGGIAYGAYLGDELIATCIFSPLPRQNISVSGLQPQQVRELSRFCVHPRYQKQNFASWFVSRCLKRLPQQYKAVVSYCDTTFNHSGSLYRACNFVQDSEVAPDYWYVSPDGWVMHKRTLYRHATNLCLTEREFAAINMYKRVYGDKKLRFVYTR